jgi:hypothetical protein
MKAKPKFRVGQVVAVIKSETIPQGLPPWYGVIEWELDGMAEVVFPDRDRLEYAIGELRPLTKREANR